MTKILFISTGDSKYGAPKSMFDLIKELKAQYDIEPVLLTKKHNFLNEECTRLGIENYSFWSRDVMSGSSFRNPILNIAKQCAKYILYLWGGITRSHIKKSGIPFSEIAIIHTNSNRTDIGAYIAKTYHIPHIWHIREFGNYLYDVKTYKPNLTAYMNGSADCFIAISAAVKKVWTQRGLNSDKIKVVYNGLDTTSFVPRKIRNDNLIKIVMTGRLQPAKGQLQLIQALNLLPSEVKNRVQVDFYGDAYRDYERFLRKLIVSFHLENIVHFHGYCSNVPTMLAEYDIGIVCSIAEGFGRVTAEYMLAGLLVIASDTGANPELIQDNISGMIYPNENSPALAEKLQKAATTPGLIDLYGKNARDRAQEKFNLQRYAAEVYNIYQQVLTNKT